MQIPNNYISVNGNVAAEILFAECKTCKVSIIFLSEIKSRQGLSFSHYDFLLIIALMTTGKVLP